MAPVIYDRLSPVYDLLTLSERHYHQQALDLVDPRPGETILEIGCGTGWVLHQVAVRTANRAQIIGLDLSAGMLGQAGRRFSPFLGAVALVRADGRSIPLRAESCDVVLASFTLELLSLDDQHTLLAHVQRVLRKNGRFVLLSLSSHRHTWMWQGYLALHEAFPQVIDCRPLNAAPLLSAAGFTVTAREDHTMFGLPLSIYLALPQVR